METSVGTTSVEIPGSAAACAKAIQAKARARLSTEPGLLEAYSDLLPKLRDLCFFDPRRGEPNPRAFAKAARAAAPETRWLLAICGPKDGVAMGVMKHMAVLDLVLEDRFAAALLCAAVAPEAALAHLAEAHLESWERELAVTLAAIGQQPILDFEEHKSLETLAQSTDAGHSPGAAELRRRCEQARALRSQHARKHLIQLLPEQLKQLPDCHFKCLWASLERDPFGTLDALRQAASSEPCANLSVGQRLDLLDRVAAIGLGLASTHLDLFAIPPNPIWVPRLQQLLRADLTAGSSLFGIYALEGIQHYPFALERIEPVLPRRISSGEAKAQLRLGDDPDEKERNYSASDIGDHAAQLQENELRHCLEQLKSEIGRNMKACVQERKLAILFGDPGLKIRDILYLLGCALFEAEETFETIFRTTQKCHPLFASNTERILLLANRYYFLDVVGLSPDLLFNRSARGPDGARTLIQDADDYALRALLAVSRSIHLRIGDTLFRSTAIAWNILLKQSEGSIDAVLQALVFLFEALDTLLTLVAPMNSDLQGWTGSLVEALVDDLPLLPDLDALNLDTLRPDGSSSTILRLTTRIALDRYRACLNSYCVQALRRRATLAGVSPINIIQELRLPRAKTDKLRALLEQYRK